MNFDVSYIRIWLWGNRDVWSEKFYQKTAESDFGKLPYMIIIISEGRNQGGSILVRVVKDASNSERCQAWLLGSLVSGLVSALVGGWGGGRGEGGGGKGLGEIGLLVLKSVGCWFTDFVFNNNNNNNNEL